ncbi:MAG TPA: hypothetical protein PLX03_08975, partial [Candidatus Hydrogenedentes bacterium]|nr:hypothetical protein [Candidatus Hydrogenedentota bacterium]
MNQLFYALTACVALLSVLAYGETPARGRDMSGSSFMRIVWDLDPAEGTEPFLDWLRERGWCWGVEIPTDAPDAHFERAAARGLWCIPQLYAHPE